MTTTAQNAPRTALSPYRESRSERGTRDRARPSPALACSCFCIVCVPHVASTIIHLGISGTNTLSVRGLSVFGPAVNDHFPDRVPMANEATEAMYLV